MNLLSKINLLGQRLRLIVQFLVIIHPDFSRTSGVPREHGSRSSGESVRMTLAKHVADPGTRDYFEGTTALPYSEILRIGIVKLLLNSNIQISAHDRKLALEQDGAH